MSTVAYVTLDVFTATRFAGNPLAVIPDARGLSDEAMQRIAAEFNYSETTFVLPPEDPRNTARVRIFTPTVEVPFAGHPNVGTAFVIGRQKEIFGRPVGGTLRFEEKAGLIVVQLLSEEGQIVGAEIKAPQPLKVGAKIETVLPSSPPSVCPSPLRR
jgi:trans-2,3-dihydro-3-hydroxyanthranilate isomerase